MPHRRRFTVVPENMVARSLRRTVIGTVIVLSLLLFVLWRIDSPRLDRLRTEVIDAVVPSVETVTAPLTAVTAILRDRADYIEVYNQNRELRREIQSLYAWREVARGLEEENAELRALNNLNLAPRTTFVTGDLIADSGGPFRESALVNVGAADGVMDGSAAVDGRGLVGRVSGVGDHAARILLLTDFSSRVPVVVQPDGRRAILAGDGTPAPRLEFLDEPEVIGTGDLVETTGDGGVFPPDLPVGQIFETQAGEVRVSLLSDYSRLEFVRLLRYGPDTRIQRPGGLVLPDRAVVTADPSPDTE